MKELVLNTKEILKEPVAATSPSNKTTDIVLASGSKPRLYLLSTVGIIPERVIIPDIDETPLKFEKPKDLAIRLANLKALKVADKVEQGFLIAADTVTSVGTKILPKATNENEARYCLELLSGRKHLINTGLCILMVKDRKIIKKSLKLVTTKITFKTLTKLEIDNYLTTQEGIGTSIGYSIQGHGQAFVKRIDGSSSNVIGGLPLFETINILKGFGYKF